METLKSKSTEQTESLDKDPTIIKNNIDQYRWSLSTMMMMIETSVMMTPPPAPSEDATKRRTATIVLLNQNNQNQRSCCSKAFNWILSSWPFNTMTTNISNNENNSINNRINNLDSIRSFLLTRVYPMTCLIFTLIFFIVLNIFLIFWIVVSLNLHQNSVFIRIQSTKKNDTVNQNEEYKLRINGDLSSNNTLFTNLIEDPNVPIQSSYHDFPESSMTYNQHGNFLKIQSSYLGGLQLESHVSNDNFEELEQQKNSVRLLSNGNLELKINKKLLIESEKPKRLLLVESNRLIIEDSSAKPHLQQQMGGLRMTQLKTNSIIGCVHQDLKIESRTKKLNMASNGMINIESNNGDIEIKSYGNVLLNTQELHMNSRIILLANLNRFNSSENNNHNNNNHGYRHRHNNIHHYHSNYNNNNISNYSKPMAYQVCMCANGQLFAAEENTLCQADQTICGSLDQ